MPFFEVLTFTGLLSVAQVGREDVRTLSEQLLMPSASGESKNSFELER